MTIVLTLLDLFGGAIVSLPIVMLLGFVFDKERAKRKWLWLALYTLYMNAMLIKVGVPAFSYITWKPTINLIPFHDFSASNILGMVLNIVMLVPFGFFLPMYSVRYQKGSRTVLAGFFMSLLIEVMQLCTFRATDIDDILMNTLGAFIGFLAAKIFIRNMKAAEKENGDLCKLIAVNVVILLVIVFVRYPLVDSILSAMGMY